MDFLQYLDYLSANGFGFAVELLSVIFGLLILIVQLKKYKLYKNSNKEDTNLKYRTENYQSAKGYKPPAQSFDSVVPVLALDEKTNRLVVVGSKDLQEIIQSNRDCGLDVILEKYGVFPTESLHVPVGTTREQLYKSEEEPIDLTDVRDDFAFLSDVSRDFEELRSRYHLPETATYADIVSHVSAYRDKLTADIEQQIKAANQKDKEEKQ